MPSWKKVLISGSDAALNSLNISSALTASGLIYPTTDGTSGQFLTTDGSGQLSFSSISGGGLGSTTKLNQTVAATTWSFAHNLNEKFPVINVYDSNDEIIIPQKIDAVDNNNILIYFSSARTGTAAAVVGGTAISASYALTASYVEGIVNSFPYTGSAQITGSLAVTGSVTSTGGFTGSLQGNATTSTTASYALTASYLEGLVDPFPYTGSAKITGSLEVTGSIKSTQGFTGSLQGNADTATTASYALTASYLPNPTVSGSIGNVNYIDFNTSFTATQPTAGRLSWNNADGTLDLGMKGGNVTQQIGQEILYEVRNETGTTISNGTVVYASGVTAGSGRITAAPYTADGSIREVRLLGMATENITNGINGFVTHFGYTRGLDTRGTAPSAIAVGDEDWSVGDILYAHPTVAGKLTNVKPKHDISVAIVIVRHQSTGVVFVRPTSYGHMEDIHDVEFNSLSTGDLLVYDSGSDYWRNTKQLSGSYSITGSLNSTIQLPDTSATPSAANAGSMRYRVSGNNSYVDMVMQTGATTYTWVNIVENNW
jgi:hypothetical protein